MYLGILLYMGIMLYVSCHGLPKGEIVRIWVFSVGKLWQIKSKTKKTQVQDKKKSEMQSDSLDCCLIAIQSVKSQKSITCPFGA